MRQELMMETPCNDELQNKWKNCIQVTCHVFRTVEYLKYHIERVWEAICNFFESLKSAFCSVWEKLSEAFEELRPFADETETRKCESYPYPQGYPHYVNKMKLNSVGFPSPTFKCARSRC